MAVIYQENLTMEEKLRILSDAAKYDVACTSSGVDRPGNGQGIGNSVAPGLCHSFAADGRCISLLKILFTNECIYDCKYCLNRSSNDVVRASFTPEEVCTLTIEFYRRNYIEGLFLSSGILRTPNYTMEQIVQALRMLREKYHFNGYIHCKAIPGADEGLIEMAGWYADRMSVNLELPTAEGLRALAPHKNRKNILLPMRKIQNGIEESQEVLGMSGGNKGAYWHTRRRLEGKSIASKQKEDQEAFRLAYPKENGRGRLNEQMLSYGRTGKESSSEEMLPERRAFGEIPTEEGISGGMLSEKRTSGEILTEEGISGGTFSENLPSVREIRQTPGKGAYQKALSALPPSAAKRGFAPAGQSTQMIIGATPESDYEIISVAEALYQKFDLKRVFYSAFVRVNDDSSLPILPGGPPLLREHRMYQADWLLRYYGFESGEILTRERPNFNLLLDPKCNWAVGHLGIFPVEISTADYFTLLRVPGIGPKSARRIVEARKSAKLGFQDLKKIGVVLKRALYFITCSGKMMYPTKIEETYIIHQLLNAGEKLPAHLQGDTFTYKQLSLFDDNGAWSLGQGGA